MCCSPCDSGFRLMLGCLKTSSGSFLIPAIILPGTAEVSGTLTRLSPGAPVRRPPPWLCPWPPWVLLGTCPNASSPSLVACPGLPSARIGFLVIVPPSPLHPAPWLWIPTFPISLSSCKSPSSFLNSLPSCPQQTS